MKDFLREIEAYALQNAIEFGKARESSVLPKLFQHGLEKNEIGQVIPLIKEIVNKVNKLDEKERLKKFESFQGIIKKREEKEKTLPELPGVKKGKKVVFRLAPFPSGALHIGNAKTYILNALYAKKYNGKIILVMDDTIGSEEKPPLKEAYKLIEEAFKFLGIKYKDVLYKSDRLKIYYEYANKLIEKNKAYVCHCSQKKLSENREKSLTCKCRHYSPSDQMKRWEEMFKAKEGEAILRIKTDMKHPNPAFRDRVLFKISDRKHPRVGNKYRVWPSLEMSWAIDDHLLGITHIIRGNDLTMETEMEKYIWNIFGWNSPEVIHVGLVAIEGVKISKSKAQKEVKSGTFIGWDDPRTWSIQSLIRRGIKKEAIIEFVEEIGLNKHDITVPIEALYAINRKMIDADSDRYSFVVNPVRISVSGLKVKELEVPVHPDKKHIRKIKVGDIYISEEDFRKFKGKEVRLLHLCNLKIEKKTYVTSLEPKKELQKINWVSDGIKGRVLMPFGNWIEGFVEGGVNELKKNSVIQFERFGFVKFDKTNKGVYEFWFAHK